MRDQQFSSVQSTEQRPWNVLHVRSNFEKRVAEHLAIRGVENFIPLYRERVKWTDRTVVAERPLFTGYVFARIFPETRMSAISSPGVVRSLGDNEGDLVSCSELEKIRAGLASGLLLRPHPNLAVGTRVRIRCGIFQGVEGTVAELRRQCKVVITLAAVRQCFSLELNMDEIELLKQPAPRASLQSIAGWSVSSAFGD